MSKVSVKYYLNKNLKGNGDRWPVYIMIIHKRNPQRIASRLFKGRCYTEKEFANDEIAQHIVKKGTAIIENTYNYLCNCDLFGKEFDIRNYKGNSISDFLDLMTEPFKDRFNEYYWETVWKKKNIVSFFNYINKQLNININITNSIIINGDYQRFFNENKLELLKVGVLVEEHEKQITGLKIKEYKYNINSELDKEIINRAKEKDIKNNWFKQIADLLYLANYHNFIADNVLRKHIKRKNVNIDVEKHLNRDLKILHASGDKEKIFTIAE